MFADQISDDSEDEDEYEHEDAPGWELSTQHSEPRIQNQKSTSARCAIGTSASGFAALHDTVSESESLADFNRSQHTAYYNCRNNK